MASKLKSAFALVITVGLTVAASCATETTEGDPEDAQPYEFPHQVSIQWRNYDDSIEPMHFCGGSLLDEYHVLTLADCNEPWYEQGFVEVVAAKHNLGGQHGGPEQRRRVLSFITHEDYERVVGRPNPNNIAVIRVDKPFEMNDKVKAVWLPEQSQQFHGMATITAWGTPIGMPSEALQKEVRNLTDFGICYRMWSYAFELERTFMCTWLEKKCIGEPGAPLVKLVRTNALQIGIASWNGWCLDSKHPALFISVANYVDWIKDKLNQ